MQCNFSIVFTDFMDLVALSNGKFLCLRSPRDFLVIPHRGTESISSLDFIGALVFDD